ncbi:MAG: hypothetical protein B7Z02_10675 [Rhodobacterales bacterium 32-67-9]|nr:MAG: hypothetical protein B7Z02_10675 [Rhodobacterales bacterium 32-67-9]
MKLVTGLLLLSASVLHMDAVWSYYVTGTVTPGTMIVTWRWVFLTLAGLWFLVPGVFDRSLARWSTGRARLLLDVFLFGLGAWLTTYWFVLVLAPESWIAHHLPRQAILALGVLWGIGYLMAFLFPGYAFRRVAAAEAEGYVADLPPLSRVGANYAALTSSGAGHYPDATAARPKMPVVTVILSVLFGFLALWSWGYPLWFPSAGHQAFLSDHSPEIQGGFGAFGAVLGWRLGGHPGKPLAVRLLQKTAGSLILGGVIAVSAPMVAATGLPYASSFAMVLSGPGNRFGLRYDRIEPAP